MYKLSYEEFRADMYKREQKRYAESLVQSTFEHWSEEACKFNADCHIEMMMRINDDEEMRKMYRQYLNNIRNV